MSGTASTVSITGMSKHYPKSDQPAVAGLELHAEAGETFGLLGPNAAGKTTTIGVCTTRIRPTSGRVVIAGWNVITDALAVRRNIGVVTQHNTLDRSCTVFENLYFHCRYFAMNRSAARRRADELLTSFGLRPRAAHKPAWLSGGMVQRVQIARAIAHRPAVLFLDEPTAGLDPQSRLALWDLLDGLRKTGSTIFLTTHYLEEAERLCDRVAIMDGGRLLACGTPSELVRSAGASTTVDITVKEPNQGTERALRGVPGVLSVDCQSDGYRVSTTGGQSSVAALVPAAAEAVIAGIRVREASLEDVFITLTGRQLRD